MADLYNRAPSWTDYLPAEWQSTINRSPVINALSAYINRRPADIEGASKRIFAQPGDREMDDRAWLLQQAQPQRRLNPLAAEMLDKGGLLANFIGPGVKLPGVPRTPGRYAMEYPGGRIDYKDMDGGVHVSGIYTNPEARGQGNAKQALQELIAAADAAKRPMSLEISPGAPGVDPARLRQWYESLGFSGPDYAMTRQPPPTGIRAYHGSPHDFDKFDISKIGTGEGAQAYGRGLYFAESEGVAKAYRDQLGNYDNVVKWKGSQPPTPDQQRIISQLSGIDVARNRQPDLASVRTDITRAINQERMSEGMPGWDADRSARRVADLRSQLATLDGMKDLVELRPPGRMYEVNIKADPEQFLDWDKPLSQQPEGVRKALPNADPGLAGERAYRLLAERQRVGQRTGDPLEDVLLDMPITDHEAAARQLRDAGIPGIKYLDQGSRAAGQGSRNYVVFDDKLIEILRKYGLLPPVAAGTAAALNQQEPPL